MALTLTVGDVIELEDGTGSIHTEDGLGVLETEAAPTDLSNYLIYGSMTLKVNTFDFALIDPSVVPPINAPLVLTTPAWTGTIASAASADPVDRGGHKVITCTATNAVQATASAAPFNLSDAPAASYALQLESGATLDLEDGTGTIDSEDLAFAYSHLTVKRTQNSDGSTSSAGSCTIYQTGLWPLQTFLLTSANQGYSNANFSVTDVTVTWQGLQQPVYRVDFGDPIVTMSVWVNSTAAGILPITTTKITDEAVTTPKIAAGSITADKLTATLILASLIRAGAGTQHVEMDQNGLRAYDPSGNLVFNMPNDGSPITINAQLVASTLVATGNAVFQGTANELALGSVLKLDSQQGNPTQAPSVAANWDSVSMSANASYDTSSSVYDRRGLDYDSAGGAGGATKVFWTVTKKASGTNYALELLASDRTVNRNISLGLASASTPYGVCRLGSYIYVLEFVIAAGTFSVYKYNQNDLTLNTHYDGIAMPVSPYRAPSICSDGTSIYITDFNDTAGNGYQWNVYDTSLVKQGATVNTAYLPVGGAPPHPDNVGDCAAGNFDYGAFRMVIANGFRKDVYTFTSAGAVQSAEQFPVPASFATADGLSYGDALGDGARFWSMSHGSNPPLTKHSNWTWTSGSSTYWTGYTWYDSAGTVHETQIGPRVSKAMNQRQQLVITTPAIPGIGGADDPNNIRFYMIQNASDPGATGFKLQATQTGTTYTATSYASGGAADPASNNFPAGTVAQIQTQAGGTSIAGDGTAIFGTSVQLLTGPNGAGTTLTNANKRLPVRIAFQSGASATYDFTSIPATFNELEFRFAWRSSDAVNALENMAWTINNITTNTYYTQHLDGSAAAATSAEVLTQANFLYPPIPGGATAQGVCVGSIRIPNYNVAGTQGWTAQYFSWIGVATTNMRAGTAGGVWNNSAIVSRVTFTPPTGFWSGSYVALYGIP